MQTVQKILKQLLTQIAKQKNCDDINKLQLPSVKPLTFEVFIRENLESIFISNYRNRSKTNLSKTNTTNNEDYVEYIKTLSNEKTMMIFTDGSALGNPEPTDLGVFIKKNGSESIEIIIAHSVTKINTSYQGELETIRIGTTYAKENKHFYRKPTYICGQPSNNTSHNRAKSSMTKTTMTSPSQK